MGDHDNRRGLPYRDVREGITPSQEPISLRRIRRVRAWQVRSRRDERHGSKPKTKDTPLYDMSVRARAFDRNLRRRTSSGPADLNSAPTGRTYDGSRPNVYNVKKLLANRGRPHMESPLQEPGHRPNCLPLRLMPLSAQRTGRSAILPVIAPLHSRLLRPVALKT